jgi:exonuclease SbcD
MKILHAADLHFGITLYGVLNKNSGLNTRLEDFINSFNQVIDYAVDNKIDLFVFAGDVYKTRYPTPVLEKVFAECVYRLYKNKIRTYIVLGNHDLRFQEDSAHAVSVIEELKMPYIKIVSKPHAELFVSEKGEQAYIVAVPYQTYRSLGLRDNIEASAVISESIKQIISELPKGKPIIVVSHFTVEGTKLQNVTVASQLAQAVKAGWSNEPVISLDAFDGADYVALGHIHKHQAWRRNGTIIAYSGGIDRCKFDEQGDKGFLVYDTDSKHLQFVKVRCRDFIEVKTDLTNSTNVVEDLRKNVKAHIKPNAVVKNKILVNERDRLLINSHTVSDLMKEVTDAGFEVEPKKEEKQEDANEQKTAGEVELLSSLEKWLSSKQEFVSYKKELLKRAMQLKENLGG